MKWLCYTSKTVKRHTKYNAICSPESPSGSKVRSATKFVEGQKLELRFPDTDTETLQFFLYWLFEGRLPQDAGDPTQRPMDEIREEHMMYVRVWVFADKHLIPMLQNESLRRLYHLTRSARVCLSIATIHTAYENTAPGSSMRQFMIDQVSLGLCNGPEGGRDSHVYVGYYTGDVGSLSDVPGFTEDLARNYMWEMRTRDKDDFITHDLTDYFVDEGGDGKGVA
jgi:hypothetical protein